MKGYETKVRRAVGERERAEYDAFGPWARLVRSAEELPPVFDPQWEGLGGFAMVIKLPFQVERRDARPGSDLYEEVVAAGPGGLVQLRVEGGEVVRRELAAAGIAGLSLDRELLDGKLLVEASSGYALCLRFNTVSAALFEDLVLYLRRLRPGAAQGPAPVSGAASDGAGRAGAAGPSADLAPPPTKDQVLLSNLLADLRRHERSIRILASQGPAKLRPRLEGRRSPGTRLAALFLRWKLDSALLIELETELLLVHEGQGPRYRGSAGYRYAMTWLPRTLLRSARIEERLLAGASPVFVLHLGCAGQDHELYFSEPPLAAIAHLGLAAG